MTTIGPNTRIEGRIEGDADVLVEGRVEGTVVLSETLTILDGGYVSGDLDVRAVVVEGALSGTVRASELVHLRATAQVSAEIYAQAVRIDPGAHFKGRVEMDVEAAPPTPRRTQRPASRPAPQRSEPAAAAPPRAAEPAPEPPRNAPEPVQRTEAPRAAQNSTPAARPQPTRATTTTTETRAAPAVRAPQPAVGDPDEMTVKELRDLLKEHDLPVSGTKQELIERVRELQ